MTTGDAPALTSSMADENDSDDDYQHNSQNGSECYDDSHVVLTQSLKQTIV